MKYDDNSDKTADLKGHCLKKGINSVMCRHRMFTPLCNNYAIELRNIIVRYVGITVIVL